MSNRAGHVIPVEDVMARCGVSGAFSPESFAATARGEWKIKGVPAEFERAWDGTLGWYDDDAAVVYAGVMGVIEANDRDHIAWRQYELDLREAVMLQREAEAEARVKENDRIERERGKTAAREAKKREDADRAKVAAKTDDRGIGLKSFKQFRDPIVRAAEAARIANAPKPERDSTEYSGR